MFSGISKSECLGAGGVGPQVSLDPLVVYMAKPPPGKSKICLSFLDHSSWVWTPKQM